MLHRKILVVHEEGRMRERLRAVLLSELDDLLIATACSGEDALAQLHLESFDLVLCSDQLTFMDAVALKAETALTPANRETPFALLMELPGGVEGIAPQGMDDVLPLPCEPGALTKLVTRRCDPRQWRIYQRVHVPGAIAELTTQGRTVEAEIINLGLGGMLTDIAEEDPFGMLVGEVAVALRAPTIGEPPIRTTAVFLRLGVIAWADAGLPAVIRVGWQFTELPTSAMERLESALQDARAGLAPDLLTSP